MRSDHKPFIYIASCYGIGIMLARGEPGFVGQAGLATLFTLIASICCSGRKTISTILLLTTIVGLGAVTTSGRQTIDRDHIKHIARYYRQKPITLKGVIISDVQARNAVNGSKQTFTIDVDQVRADWGWEKHSGKILINDFGSNAALYGDHIQIEGKLHRPYNFSTDTNFSYRDHLRHRGVYYLLSVKKNSEFQVLGNNKGWTIKSWSLKARDRLKDILTDHLSKNESGIMQAILLGDRSRLVKPVRELFVQTGTAHILAISGLHIGVVAGLFLIFSKLLPVGRRWQLGTVIIALIVYAFLTGGRPSVVRAAIMMSVFLTSLIVEKEPDPLNTLFLAATLILVYNPLNLYDIGFQLSFICVLSIILLSMKMPKIKREINASSLYRFERVMFRSISVSFAIWIGVAGLIAYYFGIITPITIIANLAVVPLISVIVALGFGLLLAGLLLPAWAMPFAICLKVVLNIMVASIFLCSKVPFSHIYVRDVKLWHVIIYYAVLVLVLYCPWRRLWFKLSLCHRLRLNNAGRIDKRARV